MQLSVPASLVGVTGPCPQCSAQISAPRPILQSPQPTVAPYQAPPQQVAPQPQAPAPAPVPVPQAQPVSSYQAPASPYAPPASRESIRPEPRHTAARPTPVAPVARLDPQAEMRSRPPVTPANVVTGKRKAPKSSIALRILIPTLILGGLGAAIFYLSQFLSSHGVDHTANADKKVVPTTSIEEELGDEEPDVPVVEVKPDKVAVKTTAPPKPLVEEIPEPPTKIKIDEPPVPTVRTAGEVVDAFLTASSFAARKPLIFTKKSDQELIAAQFDKAWPPATVVIGTQNSIPSERLIEYYFQVNFAENALGFPRIATILVHKRGDEEPKVIAEPLIDTIGGRLRQYAAAPQDKPQDFYAFMDAVMFCRSETVPNPQKKSQFHLRAHNTGEDLAVAYVNEQSEIRKAFMNPDPLENLKWKNPIAVVLTLQWNTSEDPARPFLEILEIKAKNWNP